MKITYTPECCTGEGAKYEGTVTLRGLSYTERLKLRDKVVVHTDGGRQPSATEQMLAFVEKLPEHIEEMAITRKEDGFTFRSYADLEYDDEMQDVITEMVTKLVGRFKVGNGSSSS